LRLQRKQTFPSREEIRNTGLYIHTHWLFRVPNALNIQTTEKSYSKIILNIQTWIIFLIRGTEHAIICNKGRKTDHQDSCHHNFIFILPVLTVQTTLSNFSRYAQNSNYESKNMWNQLSQIQVAHIFKCIIISWERVSTNMLANTP